MSKPCLFNCKTEGPPGPIWCRECGHDPKYCNCDWEPQCRSVDAKDQQSEPTKQQEEWDIGGEG